MSEPAAVDRARSLLNHVKHLGAPLSEFFVPVSAEEGMELLKWFRDQVDDNVMNCALLDRDIAKARKCGNPFPVLENFNLCGLQIRPREGMN